MTIIVNGTFIPFFLIGNISSIIIAKCIASKNDLLLSSIHESGKFLVDQVGKLKKLNDSYIFKFDWQNYNLNT